MKILIVGGTGMIGGHVAQLLSERHEICISSRHAPNPTSSLSVFPFLPLDYIKMDFDRNSLCNYDAVIFSAGNDVRQFPTDGDDNWYDVVNSIGIPTFFSELKKIGVPLVINISSYYPHVMPELIKSNAYVRSRKNAEDGVTALADKSFHVNNISAPFVVGVPDGVVVNMFESYVRYAEGAFISMPEFLPVGGTNFVSTRTVAEAVEGALNNGVNGKTYLIGDQNLTFAEYFGLFFDAVGRPRPKICNEEHPMLPDSAIFFGRGNTLYFDINQKERELLGYRLNDIKPAIEKIVAQYKQKC